METLTIINTSVENPNDFDKLVSVGYFFKNNTRQGFGSVESKSNSKFTIYEDREIFEFQLKLIKSNKSEEFKSIKDFGNKILKHTERLISKYYKELGFKDGLQPLHHYDIDFNNEIVVLLHRLICLNIYFLTRLGKIKNNEFNGMNYQYEKELNEREIQEMLMNQC